MMAQLGFSMMRASACPDHDASHSNSPITVNTYSPLELVHSYFVRFGVRYLVVLDARGLLKGVIFKKRWLTFLASLEED